MSARLTIGRAARAAGCKVQTIRYYEQIGLLPAPARSEGNQRLYETEDIRRLLFIRRARALGFPLPAIRDLLSLCDEPEQPCEAADAIAKVAARRGRATNRMASGTAPRARTDDRAVPGREHRRLPGHRGSEPPCRPRHRRPCGAWTQGFVAVVVRNARRHGFAVSLENAGTRTHGVIRCDQPRTLDLAARQGNT